MYTKRMTGAAIKAGGDQMIANLSISDLRLAFATALGASQEQLTLSGMTWAYITGGDAMGCDLKPTVWRLQPEHYSLTVSQ